MNRIRKDNKGVSPVIATILMVAITVVLAGVLVVYLQTLPSSGGDVDLTMGLRVSKATSGSEWIIEVNSGSKLAADVTIQVINPATGATRFSVLVSTLAAPGVAGQGVWNNNNGGTKLDVGDTIMLYSTTTPAPNTSLVAVGDKVQLLKGSSVVGTIKDLP
jgi:flagellin-like protein